VANFFFYMINLLDGPSGGSEATSSAVKDLQSKLDAVAAECLTEKEKVIDHLAFETVTAIQPWVPASYIHNHTSSHEPCRTRS
jgi:hypothetical protein